MDRTRGYQQLLSGTGTVDFAGNLDLALDHQRLLVGQLVGRVGEALPAPPRRIHPRVAAETALAPARGDRALIRFEVGGCVGHYSNETRDTALKTGVLKMKSRGAVICTGSP